MRKSGPAMLTRVRIQNFRAIEDLSLDLKPFQVLVGENNCGKTSFLDALETLQRMNELGLADAWKDPRFDFGRNLRATTDATHMRWEVSTSFGAHYALAVERPGTQKNLAVIEEQLTSDTVSFRRWLNQGTMVHEGPDPAMDLGQSMLQVGRTSPRTTEFLKGLRAYVLDPALMVKPAPTATPIKQHTSSESAPTFAPTSLKSTGEGLPAFLDRLQNDAPEDFETLQEYVRKVFPMVRYVRAPATETRDRELAIVEKGASRPLFGPQLSDGLLLLIGYLALVLSPSDALSVLMLDEPEIGLHMDRSGFLVDLLRSLSQGRFGRAVQVIVTTHSPDIVDFLEPDELVVFERNEKGVRAERLADVKDIKKRLRGFNLGEYWSNYGEAGLLRGEEE